MKGEVIMMITMTNEIAKMSLVDLQKTKEDLERQLSKDNLNLFTRQLVFSDLQDVDIELSLRKIGF